jgi:hypothetical protein
MANSLKLLLIGAGVAGLGYDGEWFFRLPKPYNKFICSYSAGLAMIVLSVIFLIADVMKFKI